MERGKRYRQDVRLPTQELRGQAVIVSLAHSEMHVLDEVGTFLWSQLVSERTPQELVRSVWEEFDVPLEQAQRDVEGFLDSLVEKGLLILE